MKLRQILKSKSGVAIENAILFILVIFSLCALLTSLTLIGHYQVKYEKNLLIQDIEIDQIGEDFLEYLANENANGTSFSSEKTKYTCEVSESDNNFILTVWLGTDKNVVLYVEATVETTVETTVEGTVEGKKVSVNKWRYSLPE